MRNKVYNKTTNLPRVLKKEIISLVKEYQNLCKEKEVTLKVEVPVKVTIQWRSDSRVDCYDYSLGNIPFEKYKEIRDINNKIKDFISRTEILGKENFNDKEWLWVAVLWDFDPSNGETYDFKKVRWLKNYDPEYD